MPKLYLRISITLLMAMAALLLVPSLPVKADGGPVVDPLLFSKLKEGQQTAVIQIFNKDTAKIDLFVSILDQTGISHDITYFVPLGMKATGFSIREEDSTSFDSANTAWLDSSIFNDYENRKTAVQMLFAGALLTNGIWFIPFWAPFLLTSCQSQDMVPAVSTYKTESSEVSIYDLNESTDIDALINTTGLDPSVKDTLLRVRGQQIAVVKLQTGSNTDINNPANSGTTGGEPGLHLSWTSELSQEGDSKAYQYPLGTGAAWASPIEITRIYIVSSPDLNVNVQYPRLGVSSPGFNISGSSYVPRIVDSQKAAYAVENAYTRDRYAGYVNQTDKIHVQRITYMNSNAGQDIVVSVSNGGPGFLESLSYRLDRGGMGTALAAGIIVAVMFWILAWYFLARRILGRDTGKRLWPMSLTYIGWNLLLFIPGAFFYFIFAMGGREPALILVVLLFGLASILIFSLRHLHKMEVSTRRAITTFTVVTLVSNGAYLLFVLGYAWLLGAI